MSAYIDDAEKREEKSTKSLLMLSTPLFELCCCEPEWVGYSFVEKKTEYNIMRSYIYRYSFFLYNTDCLTSYAQKDILIEQILLFYNNVYDSFFVFSFIPFFFAY